MAKSGFCRNWCGWWTRNRDTTWSGLSLVSRPSHRPVFDRLQYAYCKRSKLDGGKAWKHACTWDQRATKLPVLLQVYLLQVMYMTFYYLTVLCIRTTTQHYIHEIYICLFQYVHRIKGLLNFLCYCRYTYYRSCICYLAVLCVCTTQHVYDISLPESFVCVHYRTCSYT